MSDYSKEASRAVIDASKARVLAGLATMRMEIYH